MIERVDTSNVSEVMTNWSALLTRELPVVVVSSVHEEIAIVTIAIPINAIFFIMLYLLVEFVISVGKVLAGISQQRNMVALGIFNQIFIYILFSNNHAITIIYG